MKKPKSIVLSGCAALFLSIPARADVIYSGLLDSPIPTNFDGVTFDLEGGTINLFFGGIGVGNNDLLQPVRTGTGNLDPLANVPIGSLIDVNDTFSTGYGGSATHLGTTFVAGQEGNIGFRLNGVDYGWMRVVFTGNGAGALVRDWAYENGGGAIAVGRVNQGAAASGQQTVTLSPGIGESFTLGTVISNTGGNTNHLLKTGPGTATLSQANTYTGSTVISGGTLALGVDGSIDNTSGVSLGNGGTFDVSAKTGGYTVNHLTGSGTVAGDLHVSTQLAIGNSPGTIEFQGNLTLEATATHRYELDGGTATADLGIVNGDLTLEVGSVLDLLQLGTYTLDDKFTIFSYTGSLFGTFSGLANQSTFTGAGGLWRIDYQDNVPGLNSTPVLDASYVTITAVPEANSLLLAGLGVLAMLRRNRRRDPDVAG